MARIDTLAARAAVVSVAAGAPRRKSLALDSVHIPQVLGITRLSIQEFDARAVGIEFVFGIECQVALSGCNSMCVRIGSAGQSIHPMSSSVIAHAASEERGLAGTAADGSRSGRWAPRVCGVT